MLEQTCWTRRDLLRRSAALSAAAAAPSILAACSSGGSSGQGASPDLKVLVSESFWADWNPYNHFSQVQFAVQRNVFDRLVELTPDLKLVPGLATSWSQVDPRTWEFKLRDDIAFHDGQPLTGQDVKRSIELASGAAGQELTINLVWGVPHRVELVDNSTVRLRGEVPFSPLLEALTITDIVNAEDAKGDLQSLKRRPNGTGTFRLSDDKKNVKRFEAYRKHYRPTHLRSLTMEYIADAQTRVNALLSGRAGLALRMRPDQEQLVTSRDGYEVAEANSLEVVTLWLYGDRPPFDNVHIRRALAWGIDRDAVAKLVGGTTEPATSHLATGIRYAMRPEPRYTFNPRRAKEELEMAGVETPVRFEMVGTRGGYPKSAEAMELMGANLRECGFEAQLTILESAAFQEKVTSDNPGHANYSGWGNVMPDPDFAVALPFHSPGAVVPVKDSQIDELIERGKAAPEEQREAIYADLQQRLWTELPTVPVIFSGVATALDGGYDGYRPAPTFIDNFQPVTVSS